MLANCAGWRKKIGRLGGHILEQCGLGRGRCGGERAGAGCIKYSFKQNGEAALVVGQGSRWEKGTQECLGERDRCILLLII